MLIVTPASELPVTLLVTAPPKPGSLLNWLTLVTLALAEAEPVRVKVYDCPLLRTNPSPGLRAWKELP